MTDLALVARQLRREVEQGEEARQRLTKNTKKAEDKAYASSTVYGQKLLKHSTGLIAQHMANSLKNVAKGRGGQDFRVCYNHLHNADPEILAVLALKVSLDTLAKEQAPTPVELMRAIGQSIELELKLQWYKASDRSLFDRVSKGFH